MREISPGIYTPIMRHSIALEGKGTVYSDDLERLRAYLREHTSSWNSGTISERDSEGNIAAEHPAFICEVSPEDLQPGSGHWFNKNTHSLRSCSQGNWYRFSFGEYIWEGSWHLTETGAGDDYQEVSSEFLVRNVISQFHLLNLMELTCS
jgi:hypothetical protein